MLKLIFLSALFILSVSLKSAEKWVFISGDGKTNIYYDAQSLLYNKDFNTYTVNFKYEFLNRDVIRDDKDVASQYLTFIYNCSSKQNQLLAVKNVYSDSTYEYLNPNNRIYDVTSNSPEEKVFESLCK